MASPLKTTKQSVNLASDGPRVSKIRRDPPRKVKEKLVIPANERDQSDVIVGVIVFALAIFVIILAIGSYYGWSPRDYTLEV